MNFRGTTQQQSSPSPAGNRVQARSGSTTAAAPPSLLTRETSLGTTVRSSVHQYNQQQLQHAIRLSYDPRASNLRHTYEQPDQRVVKAAPPHSGISPRLEKFLKGGWRLRRFALIVKKTQGPWNVALIYILILITMITPVLFFLHYSSSPDDERHRETLINTKEFDNCLRILNLVLVIFYGIRNLLLWLLGVGVVKQKTIMYTLFLDVIVWVANVIVRFDILFQDYHWDSSNTHLLSIAGLLSGLQLNTFMLLNAVLEPLVHYKHDVLYQRDNTVSVGSVQNLINESKIPSDYKDVLQNELTAVDVDRRGELEPAAYFDFNTRVMTWVEHWSSGNIEEGDRTNIQALLDNIQFAKLVKKADAEFLRNVQGGQDDAKLSEGMVETLVHTIHQLVQGQKLKASVLVFFVFAMALTQFYFFKLSGNFLDYGLEVAASDPFEYSREFMMNIVWVFLVLAANLSTYYICAYFVSSLIANGKARVQRELTLRLLYCGSDFEHQYSPGELGNAFSGSLAKCEALWIELQYNLIFPVFSLVSAIFFFSLVDVGYAMFCLGGIPVIFAIQTVLGPRATEASERGTESAARLMGRFQNAVDLQKAFKLYQSQDFLRDRLESQLAKSRDDNYSNHVWGNIFPAAFNTIASIILTIIEVSLSFSLAAGKISAGEFYSLTYFANGIVKPIEQLGLFAGRVAFYSGAIRDIEDMLEYKYDEGEKDTESKESFNGVDDRQSQPSNRNPPGKYLKEVEEVKPLTLTKELSIENVQFQYGPDLPFVLNNVSATIPAGTYACIFGTSGSGKSTILALLEGFQACTKGRICYDGIDIASVPVAELRQKLGVVFQETHVLDGSIKENIAFGYDNNVNAGETKERRKERNKDAKGEFSMDLIIEAAKDAHIHEFIQTLPNQYDTIIGSEAEISLSGGQLQRVCGLARALLRSPELLILDEATSSLDSLSEQAVIETVLKLRERGITTVSVSHHPSTAQNADRILVLDQGIIVQAGKYDELVAVEGIFANLVAATE